MKIDEAPPLKPKPYLWIVVPWAAACFLSVLAAIFLLILVGEPVISAITRAIRSLLGK